jgi:hypothetical protein
MGRGAVGERGEGCWWVRGWWDVGLALPVEEQSMPWRECAAGEDLRTFLEGRSSSY